MGNAESAQKQINRQKIDEEQPGPESGRVRRKFYIIDFWYFDEIYFLMSFLKFIMKPNFDQILRLYKFFML